MLGGRYSIGKGDSLAPILIELRGSRTGYEVAHAWRAPEAEYRDFESRLSAWREKLRSYYDVYAR